MTPIRVDSAGTTDYRYVHHFLLSEDGPWASDTVTYNQDMGGRRGWMGIARPNDSLWEQMYTNDAMGRLASVTSPAGTFGYDYTVGQSVSPASLVRKLT